MLDSSPTQKLFLSYIISKISIFYTLELNNIKGLSYLQFISIDFIVI